MLSKNLRRQKVLKEKRPEKSKQNFYAVSDVLTRNVINLENRSNLIKTKTFLYRPLYKIRKDVCNAFEKHKNDCIIIDEKRSLNMRT